MRFKALFASLLLAALAACASFTQAQKGAGAAGIGATRTVVFLHGLYMTPKSWAEWKKRFEAAGYKVYTPAYPLHDRDPAAMRAAHPDAQLAALTFTQTRDHLRNFLKSLPEKPILVGHSMGGLLSQLFLNEGLAAGAIVLDSAAPYGIVSPLTAGRHGLDFVRTGWPFISPFASDDEPILFSEEEFAWAFANNLSESDQQRAYQEQCVPTSRRLARESLTEASELDFAKARGPLLLIAGGADRIIPASVTRLNFEEYPESAGRTEYREFEGRGHYIAAQQGWEEVADFALQWIQSNR
ncbi:MAG: alpha/beta hydrolase [Leptospirales bacterium]|nr:alpha/beta hydrolase [Leptospirales bacterium]